MARHLRYTNEARKVLAFAREEAYRLKQKSISTEHLLLAILKVNNTLIESIFATFCVSTVHVVQALECVVNHGTTPITHEPPFGVAARTVLITAEKEAVTFLSETVGVEHLFLALFSDRDGITTGVLESFGVYLDMTRQLILDALAYKHEQTRAEYPDYTIKYDTTPTLNLVSRDLTMAALSGALDPMIGRENELERAMQILSRRTKNNPVLLGHAGVGKTAIAEGLALRIIQGHVPEQLQNCRVIALDVGLLTVGTKFRGDFEERLKRIAQEIIAAKKIILVIDELHSLVSTGVAEGSLDAANLFKPMLARGELQCLGATTLEDYRKSIETDPALERRFQPIQVPETTSSETLEILRGLCSRYADFHRVAISDEGLVAAVQMSSRYITNRFQPDKAIDLLDEAAARVCVQRSVAPKNVHILREQLVMTQRAKDYAIAQRNFEVASQQRKRELQLQQELRHIEQEWYNSHEEHRPVVGEQDIAHVVAAWTGIPVMQIAADETERLLHLEDDLHRRVIGQDEAVQAVARAVRRSRTNVRNGRRPTGSFLFVGPTGVGKTELARTLAASLFDDENALIKLDMSEFMESHAVSRLIGSPPGYIGYDQGGQLTEAVHRRPYSVVLFDEIEKAHPKIFDLLLQILDDGILTDARGQKVYFRHTIIIITSNVGTGTIAFERNAMFFTSKRESTQARQIRMEQHIRAQVMPALQHTFRPELLSRIDDIILFHLLERKHLREIVDSMIERTQERIAEQSITLEVADAARCLLVEHGYDPVYGARPLRRTVQRLLEDMLAEVILKGTCVTGDTLLVDVCNGKLSLHKGAVVTRTGT